MRTFYLIILCNILNAGTGAQFLTLGTGAREIAMGGTGLVLSRGADAVYWNPALLGWMNRGHLSLMHVEHFMEIRLESMSLVYPFGFGTIGTNLMGLFTSGLEARTGPSADYESFSASFLAPNLSYSRGINQNLSFGVTLKSIYEKIYTYTASSIGLDFGVSYRTPIQGLEMGILLNNLGGKLEFEQEDFALPTTIKFGGGYKKEFYSFGFELLKPLKEEIEFRTGAEIILKSLLAFRVGYRTGYEETGSLTGLSTGLGIFYKSFHLDYAFQPFGVLGSSHRLSLGTSFSPIKIKIKPPEPPEVKPPPEVEIEIEVKPEVEGPDPEQFFEKGLKSYEQNRLKESLTNFFLTVYLNPKYPDAERYYIEVKKKLLEEKQEALIEKAVRFSNAGNLLEAYSVLLKLKTEHPLLEKVSQKLQNQLKLPQTDWEKFLKGIEYYAEEDYIKANDIWENLFEKHSGNKYLGRITGETERKRNNFIMTEKKKLEQAIEKEDWLSAREIVKKLESQKYFSPEFSVMRARVEKNVQNLGEEIFKKALDLSRRVEVFKAKFYLSKSIEIWPRNPDLSRWKPLIEDQAEKKIRAMLDEDILKEGFNAFINGDLELAEFIWKEVQKRSPMNRQANLSMEYFELLD